MAGQLIRLDVNATPQNCYDINKKVLGSTVPDGTGLQILFEVGNQHYILAGPRGGKVLTVNGGAIDKKSKSNPFVNQLAEEVEEETFGYLRLHQDGDQLNLKIQGIDKIYPLIIMQDQTHLAYKTDKYAYVTFTAVCRGLTLDQLNDIARAISPTAQFWNKMGNYLFGQLAKVPKDETFATYWQSQKDARAHLIEDLIMSYHELVETKSLLVSPLAVFNSETISDALDKLHQVENFESFNHLFKHTVGRYSERPGYYVFHADELLKAHLINAEVSDINNSMTAKGVFNKDVVEAVLSSLNQFSLDTSSESKQLSPKLGLHKSALFAVKRVEENKDNVTESVMKLDRP